MNRFALAVAVAAIGAPARAEDRQDPPAASVLHDLAAEVRSQLDDASKARVPKPVAPVPIAVKWRPQKVDSLDLGAPMLTMTAADLDRDGKSELYAVTQRDVIVIGIERWRAKELARIPLTGEPAVPAARDVVGVVLAEGGAVHAAVSSWARGVRVTWNGKAFVADAAQAGFPLCKGELAQLAPGRNYFGDAKTGTYATKCRDLVDAAGKPLHVRAQVSLAGKLDVSVQACEPAGGACQPAKHHEYSNVGVAFELADVDRNGTPEVVTSAAVAPGDPDTIRVLPFGETSALAQKALQAGGAAGFAVGDFDGNHADEILVGVRVAGATYVDLWRLN